MYNKYEKIIFKGVFLIFGICVLYFGYSTYRFKKEFYKSNFHGNIQNITYDVKRIPTITVSDIQIDLFTYGLGFDKLVEVGDSISKDTNSIVLTVYMKRDDKIILRRFNENE